MKLMSMKMNVPTLVIAAMMSVGLRPAAAQEPTAVTVVAEGKSDWQIQCPAKGLPAVSWAAEEMQTYLRRMSRCELPLAAEESTHPAIVLGKRADLSAEDQSVLPPSPKGYDGYALAVRPAQAGAPPRIVIAGESTRGIIYGVYDLLERWGCRWFYPAQDPRDPEVIPQCGTLAIPAGTWAVASPFRYRICHASAWIFTVDHRAAGKQLDWAMKNRYNGIAWGCESKSPLIAQYQGLKKSGLLAELAKREMILYGPGHCFDQFLRADDYMAEHPEWFGLRDGKRVPQTFFGAQFCWSNPQARKQFVANAAAFLEACPQIGIFCIGPFDGGKCCDCPECRKSTPSDLLLTLTGEVIDRLERQASRVPVETLGGYPPVVAPPARARIHPRQRIIWADWGRDHGISYGDPRYGRRTNLEAWQQAARGGLTVCQYYCDNFSEPWISPPFALAIQDDRKFLMEKGVDGVLVLMWSPGYWWNHSLNGYLAGRCFYNAALDPYQEIRDYAAHYFGPAAAPALAAYDEQWARQIDLAYHVRDGATDADRTMLATQRRQWIQPAVAATEGNPLYAYRVGKVEKLHTLAERLAEMHRRRGEIRNLRQEGRFMEAEKALDSLRHETDDLLTFGTSLAELNQGLVDRKDLTGFISLLFKGWLDQEAKALREKRRN
jgi:hypothetical protein